MERNVEYVFRHQKKCILNVEQLADIFALKKQSLLGLSSNLRIFIALEIEIALFGVEHAVDDLRVSQLAGGSHPASFHGNPSKRWRRLHDSLARRPL